MGPTSLQSTEMVVEADGVMRSDDSVGDMAMKNVVNRFKEVVAKNTPNVVEFSVKKVNQVEELAVNTCNLNQDMGMNSRPELCKGEGRGFVALQSGS
ncbi:hypothetical protein FH972_019760 [Carpinus fangiana]|uniref:Uncharacterized protein n=1 Tax=Carpinus fangiana TaxID=176857 RepID=A0A5N6RU95_9ROSI|nr:hypothetical protein FH972_019760 [Carpinus fangiana]